MAGKGLIARLEERSDGRDDEEEPGHQGRRDKGPGRGRGRRGGETQERALAALARAHPHPDPKEVRSRGVRECVSEKKKRGTTDETGFARAQASHERFGAGSDSLAGDHRHIERRQRRAIGAPGEWGADAFLDRADLNNNGESLTLFLANQTRFTEGFQ